MSGRPHLLLIFLIFAGALAFRLPYLDTRPLHNDEAVNAIKVAELWQEGRYRYDPDEYHGPTLHYATTPFLALSGASEPADLHDKYLRLAPVIFGAAIILLLPLFRDALGFHALLWSALFTAISPAMVFYSRYFIHEMLLVFFTALTIGAAWRYTQSKSSAWAITAGLGLGLMFATKETFVLTVAAMGLAAIATVFIHARKLAFDTSDSSTAPTPISGRAPFLESICSAIHRKHLALALAATFLVWLLFFSSFFTNFPGLLDSILTYFPWLKRAAGHSPHLHPWHFYLHRLAWFHPVKGPVWSEALILGLALVGGILAFTKKKNPFLQFITFYTIVLTTIYSVISYKTPWCLLSFYLGMLILAGVGAATLIEFSRRLPLRIVATVILLALTTQLAFQSWRTSVTHSSDRRNPYVYAQTVPDLLNLIHRVEGIAAVSTNSFQTIVKVIAPESDYWPLPWYLRRFENIGWYDSLPADPFAPIIIVSSNLEARLDDQSDRKWIMAGLTEFRPTKFFELYVELELWKKYVETLPPDPD